MTAPLGTGRPASLKPGGCARGLLQAGSAGLRELTLSPAGVLLCSSLVLHFAAHVDWLGRLSFSKVTTLPVFLVIKLPAAGGDVSALTTLPPEIGMMHLEDVVVTKLGFTFGEVLGAGKALESLFSGHVVRSW